MGLELESEVDVVASVLLRRQKFPILVSTWKVALLSYARLAREARLQHLCERMHLDFSAAPQEGGPRRGCRWSRGQRVARRALSRRFVHCRSQAAPPTS